MPALTHIWKHYTQFISLHNLKSASFDSCFHLRELFPRALQHSPVCLEDMTLHECNELEEIFSNREEEHEENEIAVLKRDHNTTTLNLGTLTNIHISRCGGLKTSSHPPLSEVWCSSKIWKYQGAKENGRNSHRHERSKGSINWEDYVSELVFDGTWISLESHLFLPRVVYNWILMNVHFVDGPDKISWVWQEL